MQSERILCREMSFLAFNRRVMAQAEDVNVPLLERLRFICIVSSNLDEFFEVRMASLMREARVNPNQIFDSGLTPKETIARVSQEAHRLIDEQYRLLNDVLLPELENENIVFLRRDVWTLAQRTWIEEYFKRELLPILTPIGLDLSHPFPRISNKSLNFIVQLEGVDAFGRDSGLAIVQAPRILPRLVKLPEEVSDGKEAFVFLSSILHEFIYKLFLGMKVVGCHQFRLTRDSDLSVVETATDNLRAAVQSELRDREYGDGVRLEVAQNCPEPIYQFLMKKFGLVEHQLYRVNGPVNLVRLISMPDKVERPDLKFPPYQPSTPKHLLNADSILDEIAKQDILLHHPYQSFDSVVRFIQEAAQDAAVVAIKMTIYRTGADSALVAALLAAVQAGKQVTVVVELMARFDEANNVNWATKLENAGAHVVYGVFGYKVHAKMAMVIRRENGSLKAYAHLGTGNYHQGTSRLYTDFGLFTADKEVVRDVNFLFMEITGMGEASRLKKLYQSPFTLHKMLIESIEREAEHARAGKPAKILAKMNALVEVSTIEALYAASQAGVKIDLIVRGMCALRPQVAGLSENIRVRSIIGRLLEHSRVFYFYNDGVENVYISSADWMRRNLFGRIETCTPVLNEALKQRVIREGLTLALQDNEKAWQMNSDGTYQRIRASENEPTIGLQSLLLNEYQA
ncbi:MAG: polyphosphate kinase 1 [Neisseriaceae bacterium]|nr:polyphosphate kinase 1 [Neisseriaceae bacterium]